MREPRNPELDHDCRRVRSESRKAGSFAARPAIALAMTFATTGSTSGLRTSVRAGPSCGLSSVTCTSATMPRSTRLRNFGTREVDEPVGASIRVVLDDHGEPRIQRRQVAGPAFDEREVPRHACDDRGVGREAEAGARAARRSERFHVTERHASGEALEIRLPISPHLGLESTRECADRWQSHAEQGVLVAVWPTAGGHHGQRDLEGATAVVRMWIERDPATVILDAGVIAVERDADVARVTRTMLRDGERDRFVQHVVHARTVAILADVHAGTPTDRLCRHARHGNTGVACRSAKAAARCPA